MAPLSMRRAHHEWISCAIVAEHIGDHAHIENREVGQYDALGRSDPEQACVMLLVGILSVWP